MDGKALRKRAAEYRRLADQANDADVKASCLLLAQIDEEEADEMEQRDFGE